MVPLKFRNDMLMGITIILLLVSIESINLIFTLSASAHYILIQTHSSLLTQVPRDLCCKADPEQLRVGRKVIFTGGRIMKVESFSSVFATFFNKSLCLVCK